MGNRLPHGLGRSGHWREWYDAIVVGSTAMPIAASRYSSLACLRVGMLGILTPAGRLGSPIQRIVGRNECHQIGSQFSNSLYKNRARDKPW
jgi:hypothetical protein